jgi:hypothetical protein
MDIKANGLDAKEIKNHHVVSLLQRDMGFAVKQFAEVEVQHIVFKKSGESKYPDPTIVFHMDANEREAFVIGHRTEIENALRVAGYRVSGCEVEE